MLSGTVLNQFFHTLQMIVTLSQYTQEYPSSEEFTIGFQEGEPKSKEERYLNLWAAESHCDVHLHFMYGFDSIEIKISSRARRVCEECLRAAVSNIDL